MIVKDHPELSHSDMGGESFEVTFPESGEYEFQCDPHAGRNERSYSRRMKKFNTNI